MTKKLFLMISMMLVMLTASAALPFDKYTINRKDLPEAAQATLKEHWPKAKVSNIKVDRHLLKKTDYVVNLTDGTKIHFSNKGSWTSVICKKNLPDSLLPAKIRKNVAKRCPDDNILRVRRSKLYYTVGVASGKELKYDLLGIFQGELTSREADQFELEAQEEAKSTD